MLGTRVILADDHTLILDALKKLLEPEFEVVGTFGDGRALVEAAPQLKPDVIVLDIGMPIMNGLNAGQRLKRLMPAVKLIYLTMNHDQDMAAEAFRIGANGYLLKNSAGVGIDRCHSSGCSRQLLRHAAHDGRCGWFARSSFQELEKHQSPDFTSERGAPAAGRRPLDERGRVHP